MKNSTDILQYHIDKELKRINPKFTKNASAKQVEKLQAQLDLNYKLKAVMVKKSRGYAALEQSLRQIDATTKPRKRWYMNLRLQIASVSAVALFALLLVSSSKLFSTNQASVSFTQSSVAANGSVDNLNNLNLMDAQNDLKVSTVDSTAVDSAQAELAGTSKLDEVINENF